jgi:hypothetical protein
MAKVMSYSEGAAEQRELTMRRSHDRVAAGNEERDQGAESPLFEKASAKSNGKGPRSKVLEFIVKEYMLPGGALLLYSGRHGYLAARGMSCNHPEPKERSADPKRLGAGP